MSKPSKAAMEAAAEIERGYLVEDHQFDDEGKYEPYFEEDIARIIDKHMALRPISVVDDENAELRREVTELRELARRFARGSTEVDQETP